MHSPWLSLTSAARTVPVVVLNQRVSSTVARGTFSVKLLAVTSQGIRNRSSSAKTSPICAMAVSSAAASAEEVDTDKIALESFRQLVPSLGGNYKGAHGKVAVVGGCLEFTGAPFFAAMSALRVGADMAYVICTPSASTAIKSYSPELMVLPYLPEQPPGSEDGPADQATVDRAVARIAPWLSRATTVVVGPGLGGDPAVCAAAAALMAEARQLGLPLVVDGSALTHVVAKNADSVAGYPSCLLTPNVAELGRIAEAVGIKLPGGMSDAWLAHAPRVAEAFRGPVVLAKGQVDLLCTAVATTTTNTDAGGIARYGIGARDTAAMQSVERLSEPQPLLRCSEPGSLRRCGGQGDVLAGTAAAFLGWASKQQQGAPARGSRVIPGLSHNLSPQPPAQFDKLPAAADNGGDGGGGGLDTSTVALCGYMACRVMRAAARRAFEAGGRSMVAGDIIPLLHPTFKDIVGRP